MNIRPETPADYHAVAAVHTSAFPTPDEARLVALLREQAAYDPALSLVAEVDGQVVGHALFMPYTIRLRDADVRAVNLAPLGVHAAHQKQGVGATLMHEGHRAAREQGFSLSFLLGHPTYYPRFGYRTHAFGDSTVSLTRRSLPDPAASPLRARAPVAADVPALLDLWLREEHAVDFAIRPGSLLTDWLSPEPRVIVSVYERDAALVGCARVHITQPDKPLGFLAADPDSARWMAADLAVSAPTLTLPLHPSSTSANAFAAAPAARAWDAAMAASLIPGVLDAYFDEIAAGLRIAGRPLWPPPFELFP